MPTEGRERARRRSRSRRVDLRVPLAFLSATVVLAPELIGGAPSWALTTIAVMCGVSCLLAVHATRGHARGRAGGVAFALAGVVLFTAATVLPLPRPLVSWLQPDAVAISDDASMLLDEAPRSWVALSLAPAATLAEVVRHAALFAAFVAAVIVAGLGGRRRILQAVGLSAAVMSLVVIAHQVLALDRVFGIYEPVSRGTPLPAPLLNANHLSGFLAMGVPVLLGLALDRSQEQASAETERRVWWAAALITAGTSIAALSRGGLLSLSIGVLTLIVFLLLRRRGRMGTRVVQLLVALAVAGGIALVVIGPWLWRELTDPDVDKLAIAAEGFGVAMDHPFLGVGRGAFEAAFVSEYAGRVRPEFPENLFVQLTSEWGFPLALALLGVIGLALVRTVRGARGIAQLGAIAGVVSIGTHDLVDFSLELPGVSVVAIVLLAAAITPRLDSGRKTSAARSTALLGWAGGAATVASALLLAPRMETLQGAELRHHLTSELETGGGPAFETEVRAAVRLHPAEPVFVLLGAAYLARQGDPAAVSWLNQAMRRAPSWGSPHVEAARYLSRIGRIEQAYLELREAARLGLERPALACELLAARPESVAAWIRAAGNDDLGARLMERSAGCIERDSAAQLAIDQHLVAAGRADAVLRSVDRAIRQERLEAASALLATLSADDERAVLLRARLALARGVPDDAIRALEGHAFGPDERAALRLLARAHAAAGHEEAVQATVARLRRISDGTAARVAEEWVFQGTLEEQMGHHAEAADAFRRANAISPESEGLWHEGRLAERLGQRARALRAYERLCRQRGTDHRACARAAQLRESPRPVRQPIPLP